MVKTNIKIIFSKKNFFFKLFFIIKKGETVEDKGDWLLRAKGREEKLTFDDIRKLWAQRTNKNLERLLLIVDSPHSGEWLDRLRENIDKYSSISLQVAAPKG